MRKLVLLLFAILLHANPNGPSGKYIGSLLCDPPTAIPYGRFLLRNFLSFDDHEGIYENNWTGHSRPDCYNSYQYQFQGFFGLNSFFDLSLSSRVYFTHKGRYAYCNTGDLVAGLDFQLLEEEKISFLPGIKWAVREVFPLGNYRLFNPKRGSMEKTGSGCFATQMALFFYKGYTLSCDWMVSTTIELQYQINSPVTAKGFHAYGGGFGANGKILVGNAWQSLMNVQLFYRQSIVLSLDALYEHQDGSNFYGYPGLSLFSKACKTHWPSSERVSLAPSFTYQFPSQMGIMIGSWFSVCGKSAEQFVQYMANLFYLY